MPATPASLQKFVQYCQQHLTGDEKGESQNFLDRFFQAFGHEGVKEAGATLEQRVKKGQQKRQYGLCRSGMAAAFAGGDEEAGRRPQ
jgi:TPP-dependent trihydroxycyclohexane-1,2-dione (THcHDO) dehydratase